MILEKLKAFIHFISLWFLIGVLVGGFAIHYYQKIQLTDATVMKCFIFNGVVYDIKERPKI